MLNVQELNKAVKEIGVSNIGWIAEADTDNADYNCFVAPDRGDVFGFDEEKGFKADTYLYWNHYIIKPSVFEGLQDIVLIGKGSTNNEV